MNKRCKKSLVLVYSIMSAVCCNGVYADNPDEVGNRQEIVVANINDQERSVNQYRISNKIVSFHSQIMSRASDSSRLEDEWELVAFKKATDRGKDKFRIEFLVPKSIQQIIEKQIAKCSQMPEQMLTTKELEQVLGEMGENLRLPEQVKLYTVDSKGEMSLRTMMGGEVFNLARSTEHGEFRSHLVDELAPGEDYTIYKNFVVKVFDDHGREIKTIHGRGMPLDASLKASKIGGIVDSLVLTNNDSQEIKIESLESTKGVMVLPEVKDIRIAPNEAYIVEIKVNPGLTPKTERGKIDEINDALLMKYEYAFDEEYSINLRKK